MRKPAKKQTAFRLSDEAMARLACLREMGFTWTQAVERGLELVHAEQIAAKNKERSQNEGRYTLKF